MNPVKYRQKCVNLKDGILTITRHVLVSGPHYSAEFGEYYGSSLWPEQEYAGLSVTHMQNPVGSGRTLREALKELRLKLALYRNPRAAKAHSRIAK